MKDKINSFKKHVAEESAKPDFMHHKWFVKWHLEIVERIAKELLEYYPQANGELVEVMVWLHDYGKVFGNREKEYEITSKEGFKKLKELGFEESFAKKAVDYIELLNKKFDIDLRKSPIEVQIVSSADGCSHLVGPFMHLFWHEATDSTFTGLSFEELMDENIKKAKKDWKYKIVLPEARDSFQTRYKILMEQSGKLPERFIKQ